MKPGNGLSGWAVKCACLFVFSVAALFISAVTHGQTAERPLTLKRAITHALDQHPRLQIFQLRQQGLDGLRQSAALSPAWRLEAEVENFAGTGEVQGFDVSEQTLALSSVIELGGKRAARIAVVDARTGLVDTERQIAALELVSRVTQNFIEALAAQQRLELANEALDVAQTTLQVVRQRAEAGAAPQAEVLRADAAKTRAKLAVARVRRELATQRVKLAVLLGVTAKDFGSVAGNLFRLPPADDFAQLYQRARDNPVMEALMDKQRLKKAELQLARSQASSDIEWQLGVRRMAATGDTGLVASISLPLFTGSRSRGDIKAARAELDQVYFRRQDALRKLHAQLYEAYANRQQNIATVQALREQVIPTLTKALQITQRAYETGRYSYIDWVAAQRELLNAKRALIDAAAAALSYGAVIEQFTAEPLSTADAPGVNEQDRINP